MTLSPTHTGLGIKFNIVIYAVVQVISMKGIIRVFSETICAATRFNQNRRHNTIREISFGEYKRFPGAELRETVIVKTPVH